MNTMKMKKQATTQNDIQTHNDQKREKKNTNCLVQFRTVLFAKETAFTRIGHVDLIIDIFMYICHLFCIWWPNQHPIIGCIAKGCLLLFGTFMETCVFYVVRTMLDVFVDLMLRYEICKIFRYFSGDDLWLWCFDNMTFDGWMWLVRANFVHRWWFVLNCMSTEISDEPGEKRNNLIVVASFVSFFCCTASNNGPKAVPSIRKFQTRNGKQLWLAYAAFESFIMIVCGIRLIVIPQLQL